MSVINELSRSIPSIAPVVECGGALSFFWDKVKALAEAIVFVIGLGSIVGVPILYYFYNRKVELIKNDLPEQILPLYSAAVFRSIPSPTVVDSQSDSSLSPIQKTEEELDDEMINELEARHNAYIEKARGVIKAKGKVDRFTHNQLHVQVIEILKKNKKEGHLAGIEHVIFQEILAQNLARDLDQVIGKDVDDYYRARENLVASGYEQNLIHDVNEEIGIVSKKSEVKEILLAYGYEEDKFNKAIAQHLLGKISVE